MIHPTAIIDPDAVIADDVEIGPFNVIGAGVEIGAGTVVGPSNVFKGPTKIGKNNRFLQFSSIGEDTPDLKYAGEATTLVIGDNNTIRECVTIHRGTVQDQGETRIGDNNLLMAYVHVGHDCVIGNHTILVNNASLAGHCHLDDWAILAGYAGVHQYCDVGAHAFVGAYSKVVQDVPAYVMAVGIPAESRTINSEGLRRRDFSSEDIRVLKRAYKRVFRDKGDLSSAIAELDAQVKEFPVLAPFVESLRSTKRGLAR